MCIVLDRLVENKLIGMYSANSNVRFSNICLFSYQSHTTCYLYYVKINTDKRTRTSRHCIKTLLDSGILQHLKGHLQGVYLIYFSRKFNNMNHQM